ncbi:MAG: hypothetical protein GY720_05800 [bacterium]|nr:hypothetical protein [bacterium]
MSDGLHPWLARLIALNLPPHDYALFGSGPLLVRGWISEVGDLDVLARGAAWEQVLQSGRLVHLDAFDVDVVLIGEHISVGTRWGIGHFDVNQLIDDAELIKGIPCVRLDHVAAYKRIAGRPKDDAHLQIISRRAADGG